MPTFGWAGSSIAMIGGPYTQRGDFATRLHGEQMGGTMGPVNWVAVILAAMLAVALGFVWRGPLLRQAHWPNYLATGGVMLLASAMLGHAYARIGA